MEFKKIFNPFKKATIAVVTAPVKVVQKGAEVVEKGVDKAMQAMILGLIRHLLTGLGGYLVSVGLVTGDQSADLIGAVMVIASTGWSVYQKKQQKAEVKIALETPVPPKP
jgi:hypothetical protein